MKKNSIKSFYESFLKSYYNYPSLTDDEWYEYKSEALKQMVIDWCKEDSVEYVL